jgi:hypothetical protein
VNHDVYTPLTKESINEYKEVIKTIADTKLFCGKTTSDDDRSNMGGQGNIKSATTGDAKALLAKTEEYVKVLESKTTFREMRLYIHQRTTAKNTGFDIKAFQSAYLKYLNVSNKKTPFPNQITWLLEIIEEHIPTTASHKRKKNNVVPTDRKKLSRRLLAWLGPKFLIHVTGETQKVLREYLDPSNTATGDFYALIRKTNSYTEWRRRSVIKGGMNLKNWIQVFDPRSRMYQNTNKRVRAMWKWRILLELLHSRLVWTGCFLEGVTKPKVSNWGEMEKKRYDIPTVTRGVVVDFALNETDFGVGNLLLVPHDKPQSHRMGRTRASAYVSIFDSIQDDQFAGADHKNLPYVNAVAVLLVRCIQNRSLHGCVPIPWKNVLDWTYGGDEWTVSCHALYSGNSHSKVSSVNKSSINARTPKLKHKEKSLILADATLMGLTRAFLTHNQIYCIDAFLVLFTTPSETVGTRTTPGERAKMFEQAYSADQYDANINQTDRRFLVQLICNDSDPGESSILASVSQTRRVHMIRELLSSKGVGNKKKKEDAVVSVNSARDFCEKYQFLDITQSPIMELHESDVSARYSQQIAISNLWNALTKDNKNTSTNHVVGKGVIGYHRIVGGGKK